MPKTVLENSLKKLEKKAISWDDFFKAHKDFSKWEIVANEYGNTLLHIAIIQNRSDILSEFNLHNQKNLYGFTPFQLATLLDRKSCLMLLDPKGAKKEIPSWSSIHKVEYLHSLVFESFSILEKFCKSYLKAKEKDIIAPSKIWLGIFYEKEIRTNYIPKVELKWVNDLIGFGAFAAQDIPGSTFLGEYTGVVKERKKIPKKNYYCMRYSINPDGRSRFNIDAEHRGNFTRFINHSENPNMILQSIICDDLLRMIFISLKDIPKGTQLFFDYGKKYWKQCGLKPEPLKR